MCHDGYGKKRNSSTGVTFGFPYHYFDQIVQSPDHLSHPISNTNGILQKRIPILFPFLCRFTFPVPSQLCTFPVDCFQDTIEQRVVYSFQSTKLPSSQSCSRLVSNRVSKPQKEWPLSWTLPRASPRRSRVRTVRLRDEYHNDLFTKPLVREREREKTNDSLGGTTPLLQGRTAWEKKKSHFFSRRGNTSRARSAACAEAQRCAAESLAFRSEFP